MLNCLRLILGQHHGAQIVRAGEKGCKCRKNRINLQIYVRDLVEYPGCKDLLGAIQRPVGFK